MRIGEVARMSGIPRETLRFYEKEGMLGAIRRDNNGYRDYPQSILHRLQSILELKNLGFTLGWIKQILDVEGSKRNCHSMGNELQSLLLDIRARMKRLESLEARVQAQIQECRTAGLAPGEKCPSLALCHSSSRNS